MLDQIINLTSPDNAMSGPPMPHISPTILLDQILSRGSLPVREGTPTSTVNTRRASVSRMIASILKRDLNHPSVLQPISSSDPMSNQREEDASRSVYESILRHTNANCEEFYSLIDRQLRDTYPHTLRKIQKLLGPSCDQLMFIGNSASCIEHDDHHELGSSVEEIPSQFETSSVCDVDFLMSVTMVLSVMMGDSIYDGSSYDESVTTDNMLNDDQPTVEDEIIMDDNNREFSSYSFECPSETTSTSNETNIMNKLIRMIQSEDLDGCLAIIDALEPPDNFDPGDLVVYTGHIMTEPPSFETLKQELKLAFKEYIFSSNHHPKVSLDERCSNNFNYQKGSFLQSTDETDIKKLCDILPTESYFSISIDMASCLEETVDETLQVWTALHSSKKNVYLTELPHGELPFFLDGARTFLLDIGSKSPVGLWLIFECTIRLSTGIRRYECVTRKSDGISGNKQINDDPSAIMRGGCSENNNGASMPMDVVWVIIDCYMSHLPDHRLRWQIDDFLVKCVMNCITPEINHVSTIRQGLNASQTYSRICTVLHELETSKKDNSSLNSSSNSQSKLPLVFDSSTDNLPVVSQIGLEYLDVLSLVYGSYSSTVLRLLSLKPFQVSQILYRDIKKYHEHVLDMSSKNNFLQQTIKHDSVLTEKSREVRKHDRKFFSVRTVSKELTDILTISDERQTEDNLPNKIKIKLPDGCLHGFTLITNSNEDEKAGYLDDELFLQSNDNDVIETNHEMINSDSGSIKDKTLRTLKGLYDGVSKSRELKWNGKNYSKIKKQSLKLQKQQTKTELDSTIANTTSTDSLLQCGDTFMDDGSFDVLDPVNWNIPSKKDHDNDIDDDLDDLLLEQMTDEEDFLKSETDENRILQSDKNFISDFIKEISPSKAEIFKSKPGIFLRPGAYSLGLKTTLYQYWWYALGITIVGYSSKLSCIEGDRYNVDPAIMYNFEGSFHNYQKDNEQETKSNVKSMELFSVYNLLTMFVLPLFMLPNNSVQEANDRDLLFNILSLSSYQPTETKRPFIETTVNDDRGTDVTKVNINEGPNSICHPKRKKGRPCKKIDKIDADIMKAKTHEEYIRIIDKKATIEKKREERNKRRSSTLSITITSNKKPSKQDTRNNFLNKRVTKKSADNIMPMDASKIQAVKALETYILNHYRRPGGDVKLEKDAEVKDNNGNVYFSFWDSQIIEPLRKLFSSQFINSKRQFHSSHMMTMYTLMNTLSNRLSIAYLEYLYGINKAQLWAYNPSMDWGTIEHLPSFTSTCLNFVFPTKKKNQASGKSNNNFYDENSEELFHFTAADYLSDYAHFQGSKFSGKEAEMFSMKNGCRMDTFEWTMFLKRLRSDLTLNKQSVFDNGKSNCNQQIKCGGSNSNSKVITGHDSIIDNEFNKNNSTPSNPTTNFNNHNIIFPEGSPLLLYCPPFNRKQFQLHEQAFSLNENLKSIGSIVLALNKLLGSMVYDSLTFFLINLELLHVFAPNMYRVYELPVKIMKAMINHKNSSTSYYEGEKEGKKKSDNTSIQIVTKETIIERDILMIVKALKKKTNRSLFLIEEFTEQNSEDEEKKIKSKEEYNEMNNNNNNELLSPEETNGGIVQNNSSIPTLQTPNSLFDVESDAFRKVTKIDDVLPCSNLEDIINLTILEPTYTIDISDDQKKLVIKKIEKKHTKHNQEKNEKYYLYGTNHN